VGERTRETKYEPEDVMSVALKAASEGTPVEIPLSYVNKVLSDDSE